MSEDMKQHISNQEALLEKIFGYVEILTNAIVLIDKQIEQQNKIEKAVFQSARENQLKQEEDIIQAKPKP